MAKRGNDDDDEVFNAEFVAPRAPLHAPTPMPSRAHVGPRSAGPRNPCMCVDPTPPPTPPIVPECHCPQGEQDIVIHVDTCMLYKNETFVNNGEEEVCEICACTVDRCTCKKAGKEVLDEWRKSRAQGAIPAVLESTHPLMQKFQDSLSRFLQKENERAEQEIIVLRDDLKLCKKAYDTDLEAIYLQDHHTNNQRNLIMEYDESISKERKTREDAANRARTVNVKYKAEKQKLDADMANYQEQKQEMEALQSLVRQLEEWREETESELTVNQKINEKMRQEKKVKADEKRKLDIIILSLNNEVWRLESNIELIKQQMDIKASELEKVTDRSTAYVTELEDLEIDKKRLMSLWNSVLVNIRSRDRVYMTVREDYAILQENYHTLIVNVDITKKAGQEAMERSKDLAMQRDKMLYDTSQVGKQFEYEDLRRGELMQGIEDTNNAIKMSEQDEMLIKTENQTMRNILKSTQLDVDRRLELKRKIENEIIQNLQDCLLNDKAVASMANGIKNMRDMGRKLEIALMTMENQHAKVMLDIEVHRARQAQNNKVLEKTLGKVREKEKEIEDMQDKYDTNNTVFLQKQRELESVQKKFNALKEIYDMKSPQEIRLEELEIHIRMTREKTEKMQHTWLRLQGHVVRLTAQYQKLDYDIGLINKQIQICNQRVMLSKAAIERVLDERAKVERALRDHHSRLQVLEKTKKECKDKNEDSQRQNLALTYEYTSNLKSAEGELLDLEDEIENLETEKVDLTQELDRVQKEALVWQRKGILAVELKRNIKESKSAAGDIGQMKHEIHRMEVRREQLRKTGEKLAEDLAQYVTRRENLLDRTRASAALEASKGHSSTSLAQSTYKHKLRMAKCNLQRVTKDLADAKATMKELQTEQQTLEKEIEENGSANAQLEERVASLLRECRELERDKQYLLERVVRNQRFGNELQKAVKRQTLRLRKPKKSVLEEYQKGRLLNDRIQYIIDNINKEYPYLEDKLEMITNTLKIESPTGSPRMTDAVACHGGTEFGDPTCVIPEGLQPEVPYWQKDEPPCRCDRDTCDVPEGFDLDQDEK